MGNDESIVLFIILRQSLNFDGNQTAYCAANAVEHLLLKYFTLQVLAAKTHLDTLVNNNHVKTTTRWLATKSCKNIVSVDEIIWSKVKSEFSIGKDIFCLKDSDLDKETTLVLWPDQLDHIPSYLRDIVNSWEPNQKK